MKNKFQQELFNQMPIIGILRNVPIAKAELIIPYYIKAGFTTLEITMNSADVCETLRLLTGKYTNFNIGAGTVCTRQDLEMALENGASFIVSPIVNEEVMQFCVTNGIPIFPGAYTPQEIYHAANLGATAVKVFPATKLGPGFIKDVLAALDTLKLLPTGGVSLDNMDAYFKAGAVGLGMGSSLFNQELIANNDFTGLYNHFKLIADKVMNHKSKDK